MNSSMENLEKDATESSTSLSIEISGEIRLRNAPPQMKKAIKDRLKLPNPTYEQAIRANPRAKYTLSPFIRYWEEDKQTGDLIIGRGCEEAVRAYGARSGIRIERSDERVERPFDTSITTTITPREYQRGVVDKADGKSSGIFRLDTGFGKTLIGIELIAKLNQRTLIIVPKLDLLNQYVREIKQWTDVENVGVIQGKNVDIQDITVATIQSLGKWLDRTDGGDTSFGCILVDECHQFVSDKRIRLLQRLKARYLFGFTATARRSDGQGEALKWVFGPILVDRKIPRAVPTVRLAPFHGHIWVQQYSDMILEQIENEERNAYVANIIKQQKDMGRRVLVLCKRVAHYETLAALVGDEGTITFDSGQKTEERDALLTGLREGTVEFSCLFGTFALLSTGIDIPSLDTLVIAGDLKSDVLAEQSAGRILRLLEGKDNPLIIDIQDLGNPILKNQAKLRQKFYEKEKWNIKPLVEETTRGDGRERRLDI